jgi:dTDP-glucose 4,6-dehydratase
MRLLITGGAGFIGSNFIHYLTKNHPDYKIVNLDKLTYAGNLNNLKDLENNKNYSFIRGDICDEKLVDRFSKDCDCIINFAAETHVDRSIADASDFIRTNVFGVHNILENIRKNEVKRFIQISTDEVYGSCKNGSFKEEDTLKPNSPYAASKASADLLVRSYIKTYDIPAIIVRSSNNFGPYQFPEKVIPLFITNLFEDKKVPLYAKGENIRDWLFVDDNCAAIDIILDKGKVGKIYNIAAGNELSNIELTKKILRQIKKNDEFIEYVEDRPGHDFRYSLNSDKIRGLGWAPKYNFEDALSLTINWYKQNKKWWRPLKKK